MAAFYRDNRVEFRLSGEKRQARGGEILPSAGIDEGVVFGAEAGEGDLGAEEVLASRELRELKCAVRPGEGVLLESAGGDVDDGAERKAFLVADFTGKGGGVGGSLGCQ